MRCYICNRVLSDPQFNADHGDIDPCDPCLQIIQDTVEAFKDKPSAPDDDTDLSILLDNLPLP